MSVPSDISSYLTSDEKVVMIGKNAWEIYVTNKRLILKKKGVFGGKEIVEASYRHISSIEYRRKIPLGYFIAGICVIVFGTLLGLLMTYLMFGNPGGWYMWYGSDFTTKLQILLSLPIICGAILILIGVALLARPPVFTIHIVGRKPIWIRGKKLDGIIRIIREYREKIEAEISEKR